MKNLIDSGAVLDYVLFQLTPTRTRCDLVIYAGKKSEKIASGLLDPFLSHLKSAKDQIYRGGYSITLQPPPSDASSWFTKTTLNRFVRFVNTPEILERFVSIDKEIGQLEKEIDLNGLSNATVEQQGDDGEDAVEAEEKPKVRLQRVLKSRKAILEKELAMAYARALVAGFEMNDLQDLVSFSDAFGAQRLREACVSFMEICNRKNDDKIWMDEVAAVQASYIGSAVALASFENNDLSQSYQANSSSPDPISLDPTEENASSSSVEFSQLPGAQTWRNNFPQYMQNANGPYSMFPQMPPYPGYMFPGFQVPSASHYPPNMAWPGSFVNSGTNLDKDTKKKDRNIDRERTDSSDEQEDNNISATEEASHKKKASKKSSGKVVIRNINFIAGNRKDVKGSDSDGYSSTGDDYVDADSIKSHVEAAVGSLRRNRKSKSKKSEQRTRNHSEVEDFEPPHSEEESKDGNWDAFQNFLMKDSEPRSEHTMSRAVHVKEDYLEEILSKKIERKFENEDFLFTERSTGSEAKGSDVRFEGGELNRGVIKRSNGEDVLIPNRLEGEYKLQNGVLGTESTIIRPQKEEDWIAGEKPYSYSNRVPSLDQSNYQASGNSHFQIRDSETDVLDDSFMVQNRSFEGTKRTDSKADMFVDSDIVAESHKFTEPEDFYMINRNDSSKEQAAAASWTPEMDYRSNVQKINKEEVVLVATEKPAKKVVEKDAKAKAKAPPGRSKSAIPTRSKISPSGTSSNKNRVNSEEERRKRMEELLIQRQKRIVERSSGKGVTSENTKTVSKQSNKNSGSSQTKQQAPVNENRPLNKALTRSATMDRLATPRTINKLPSTESRTRSNLTTASASKKSIDHKGKVNTTDKRTVSKNRSTNNGIGDFDIVKDLHTITSVETKEPEADMKNSSIQVHSDEIISLKDASVELKLQDDLNLVQSPVTLNTNTHSGTEIEVQQKKITFSPDISVMDISTPSLYSEANTELATSRKKWGDGENSPKAPKGFRKLLLFGRKS